MNHAKTLKIKGISRQISVPNKNPLDDPIVFLTSTLKKIFHLRLTFIKCFLKYLTDFLIKNGLKSNS